MNFTDWYTDKMDVFRTTSQVVNGITKQTLPNSPLYANIPCRIYQSKTPPITLKDTAAQVSGDNKLMCDRSVDVSKGDVLIVTRGSATEKYFAGDIQEYTEPFGAILPGLAHKEICISKQVRT